MKHTVRGLKGMIDALDEVSGEPSTAAIAKLETLLTSMFWTNQSRVHVITGRLWQSGRTASELKGKQWSGHIAYGGPSSSVAYYGIYEMHRSGVKPGLGPHDFFSGLEVYDPQFEKAIDQHFKPLSGK